MLTPDIIKQLFANQADTVIVTPNRRLSNYLIQQYNQYQQQVNYNDNDNDSYSSFAIANLSGVAANIYPLNSWLEQLWSAARDEQRVLSPLQQQLIWEQIIAATELGQQLLNVKIAAEQAAQAWNVLQEWQISLQELQQYTLSTSGADCRIFLNWASNYQDRLTAKRWLDFNSMLDQLIKLLTQIIPLSLPKQCYLIGFRELTPQQQQLKTALGQAGVKVIEQHLVNMADNKANKVIAVSAADAEQEYLLAAKWAQQQRQANPQHRIGIMVPELATCRKEVEQAFVSVFGYNVGTDSYNISAPRPLATYSMIDTALLIIQLAASDLVELELFSRLLRSNYIASSTELPARSLFDVKLRELQIGKFIWQTLTDYVAELALGDNYQKFNSVWQNWCAVVPAAQTAEVHSVQHWADLITNLLQSWGWPGDGELSSVEQDLLASWQLLLTDYLQLADLLGQHNFATAWHTLVKLAANRPFLPETGDPPIQVLGLLEAAGMPFDQLWLCGMHSDYWPPEPQPNPFIPLPLQIKYGLPHSSPQRELTVAKQLTAMLINGGKQRVVISYPQQLADVKLAISPLLQHVEQSNSDEIVEPLTIPIVPTIELAQSNDLYGPAYTQAALVPGGSRVLKLQANCPFWAFAEIRLGAKPLKTATLGLTAAERGTLLHDVLAEFWLQIGKVNNIWQNLTAAEISDYLEKIIYKKLSKFKAKRELLLTPDYFNLESKRLQNLLTAWLELERQREPFTVYQLETKRLIRLGSLQFSLRLDRIDQLMSGEIFIIDYKTGKPQISGWFGERVLEPQLPLYCLATESMAAELMAAEVSSTEIALAVINTNQLKLLNYSALQHANKAATWQQQLQIWRQNLTDIADEFAQGYAAVQPAQGTATCRNCQLQSFCRIQ